ncbi:MAG: hypothetical protein KDD66_08230 [Bdellovibrionales bacterium]|nr:hypothetical protein [Bdellovibrionales bacterium]
MLTIRRLLIIAIVLLPAFTTSAAAQELESEAADNQIPLLIGAAIFVIGILNITVRRWWRAARKATRDPSAVTADPTPWRKNKEWASGRLESKAAFRLKVLWGMAAFLALPSVGAIVGIKKVISESGNYGILALGLFPLITLFILITAIKHTIRWRRYGKAYFALEGETGVAGGALNGTITAMTPVHGKNDFVLKLECTETIRVKRAGDSSYTSKRMSRWSRSKKIPANSCDLIAGVPVSFEIPDDVLESNDPHAEGPVSWWLTLSEPTKGVDYHAEFEVPVYRRFE